MSNCSAECSFYHMYGHIDGTEEMLADPPENKEPYRSLVAGSNRKGIHHYGSIKWKGQHVFKIGSRWQKDQLKTLGWIEKGQGKYYWYMERPAVLS